MSALCAVCVITVTVYTDLQTTHLFDYDILHCFTDTDF